LGIEQGLTDRGVSALLVLTGMRRLALVSDPPGGIKAHRI
jgi:hypothetical protein